MHEAPTFISLIPELHAGTGHVLGYHLSAHDAARIAGWRCVALVPRDHGLGSALPSGWRAELRPATTTVGLPQILRHGGARRLFRDMAGFARSVREAVGMAAGETSGESVVFLERFNGPQLVAAAKGLRALPRDRFRFWVMVRSDLSGVVGGAYALAILRIAREWRDRFRLLADSEPLARSLERRLGIPVHVMPIPHTHVSTAAPFPREANEIVCWWPGPPRAEKGLGTIRALASLTAARCDRTVKLVLSEEAGVAAGAAIRVQCLPARLSAQEYDRWLATADVVLLPYDPARYRHATSGIFAEAVVAGRVPLASAGTWMARELHAHGLAELVVDQHDAVGLLARICAVSCDPGIRAKLARMQAHFAAYHCESSFAMRLAELFSPASHVAG
jgi:hypothetical protein